ncbi:Sec-independent protein translocase subunit TatB [Oxalobacteraceae bacterium CAVE-383]|nr:Sec-independent protein translocase subunit TatB [Oxalobacteraceae bacterium CAVE-383]
MIDIGITKLAVIGVVALVVVGPERLPKVARMAGTLFGRAQRYINDVKSEVGREIELEELRKMHKDVETAASDISQGFAKEMTDAEHAITSAWDEKGNFDHNRYDIPTIESLDRKARNFRQKKLQRNSATPSWYKHQTGRRTRVISAAARVAKYRPASGKSTGSFF